MVDSRTTSSTTIYKQPLLFSPTYINPGDKGIFPDSISPTLLQLVRYCLFHHPTDAIARQLTLSRQASRTGNPTPSPPYHLHPPHIGHNPRGTHLSQPASLISRPPLYLNPSCSPFVPFPIHHHGQHLRQRVPTRSPRRERAPLTPGLFPARKPVLLRATQSRRPPANPRVRLTSKSPEPGRRANEGGRGGRGA